MTKEVLNFTVEKTNELINSPTCSSETKEAAQKWLASIGGENQASETQKYVDELEADIMPIDNLINFAESASGAQVFGTNAPNVAAHAKEIKASGAKYCDCPACVAVAAILEQRNELLK